MIEMTGRRARRRKQLLDDFEEMREYWEVTRGNTRLHSAEITVLKRLWI
jgi:hypothetical protein